MNEEDRLPDVPQSLIDYLKQHFPLRPPTVQQTDRSIWVDVGRQDIITRLENLRNHKAEEQSPTRVEI